MEHITEWRHVDRRVFVEEVMPANEPAVLRSVVSSWPAVQAGVKSPAEIAAYIGQFDSGRPCAAVVGPPAIEGRFFYSEDLKGFNFQRRKVPVQMLLDELVSLSNAPHPPAIAMQAVLVPEVLSGFEVANPIALLDPAIAPRLWLGNRAITAAHFDTNHNIACVVTGARKFTLFAPEQTANLYVGPLLNTPAGTPISMVDLRNPDLVKYPRFREALAQGQEAQLEPGDAIYIPALWWHAVESLATVNVLANYWWNDDASVQDNPFHSLLHAMLLLSKLPDEQRMAWRALFDAFVFQTDGSPADHLPPELKDIQKSLTLEEKQQVKAWLAEQLKP